MRPSSSRREMTISLVLPSERASIWESEMHLISCSTTLTVPRHCSTIINGSRYELDSRSAKVIVQEKGSASLELTLCFLEFTHNDQVVRQHRVFQAGFAFWFLEITLNKGRCKSEPAFFFDTLFRNSSRECVPPFSREVRLDNDPHPTTPQWSFWIPAYAGMTTLGFRGTQEARFILSQNCPE